MKQLQDFKISELPRSPGVYLMKNADGEILYVGKASNLKSRISSYFSREAENRYQIKFLMSKVSDIETIITDTDKEALLLENTLIKKHRPRYNIDLKDDKSYPSIKISIKDDFPRIYVTRQIKKDGSLYFGPYTRAGACHELIDFVQNHFRLRTCSDHDFRNRVRPCLQYQIHRCDAPCVGYINKEDYHKIVRQVRLFLEGRGSELKQKVETLMKNAAAEEKFEEAARYRNLLYDMEVLQEKQKVVSHQNLSRDVIAMQREGEQIAYYLMMVREGSLQESRSFFFKSHEDDGDFLSSFLAQYYEEGKFIPQEILVSSDFTDRKTLAEILSERAGYKVYLLYPQRGEKSSLMKLAEQNAQQALQNRQKKEKALEEVLQDLQKQLELKNLPRRIECYDISNFQGKESVGSRVFFQDGKPDKKRYRHFKIQSVQGANDFASIYEIISRRLKKGLESQQHNREDAWSLPDLIIIDGGKGQLNAAAQAFKDLEVKEVDLISLAKSRLEGEASPFLKTRIEERQRSEERVFLRNRKDPVFFRNNSSALFLLVQLRDEAHRFGIEFHRKLRQKRTLYSALDEIKGVGKARRQKLLKQFGSLKRIKEAPTEAIAQISGISLELAKTIKQSL